MEISKGIRILVLLIKPILSFIGCDEVLTDEEINEKYSKIAISIYQKNSEQYCGSMAHSVNDPSGLKIYIPKGYEYSVGKNEKSFEISSYAPGTIRYRIDYSFWITKNVSEEDSKTNFQHYILNDMKISAVRDYGYDDNDIIYIIFESPIDRGLKFRSQGGFRNSNQLVEIVCDIKLNYIQMQNSPELLNEIKAE